MKEKRREAGRLCAAACLCSAAEKRAVHPKSAEMEGLEKGVAWCNGTVKTVTHLGPLMHDVVGADFAPMLSYSLKPLQLRLFLSQYLLT